jgi:putative transposase
MADVKTNRAIKYRIKPNKAQEQLLQQTFGCVRLVYNHYLAERINAYDKNGTSLNYYDNANDLKLLKKELSFLKDVDSIALQQSLRHLDTAYKNFFRDKKVGFPKFKSKKNNHKSYSTVCVNNNICYCLINCSFNIFKTYAFFTVICKYASVKIMIIGFFYKFNNTLR